MPHGSYRVVVSTGEAQDVHLHVQGEIDMAVAPDLLHTIECAAATYDNHHIVVDLSDVGFMDSRGLAALIEAHRRLGRQRSHLVVVNPSAMIAKLIETTGIDSYLDVRSASFAQ